METFHLRVGQSTKERDIIKRLMLMAAVTMLAIMPAITFAHETEPGSPAVPPHLCRPFHPGPPDFGWRP